MTQEQKTMVEDIEGAVSFIKYKDEQDYITAEEYYHIFKYHGKTIRYALTQALEIAKGDKVVVPREPTQEMIDVGIEQIAFGNDFMDAYEAMIAVAEGEK